MSFIYRFFTRQNHKKTTKKLPNGVCGLYNLGNTCYMNCILQSIAHSKLFQNFCLTQDNLIRKDIAPGNETQYHNKISIALIALIQAMFCGDYAICTPRGIKEIMGEKNIMFKGNNQNDASEFFLFLLDELDKEMRGTQSGIPISLPKDDLPILPIKINDHQVGVPEIAKTKISPKPLVLEIAPSEKTEIHEGSPLIKRGEFVTIKLEEDNPLVHSVTIQETPDSEENNERNEINEQKHEMSQEMVLTLSKNSENFLKIKDNIINDGYLQKENRIKISMGCSAFEKYVQNNQSIISELFFGMLLKRTLCDCGNYSDNHNPFATLPIDIPLPKEVDGYFPVVFIGKEGLPKLFYIWTEIRPNMKELKERIEAKVQKKINGIWCECGKIIPVDFENVPQALDLRGARKLLAFEKIERPKLIYIQVSVRGELRRQLIPILVEKDKLKERLSVFGVEKPFNEEKVKKGWLLTFKGEEEDIEKFGTMEREEEPNQNILNPNGISLEWCLNDFFKENILGKGNEWKCSQCGKKVNARQKCIIEYPPNVLVIQLKRFRYTEHLSVVKDNSLVYFPIEIDLHQFGMVGKYRLNSVVNHRGTLNGGHYYSYCRCGSDWFVFNDDTVTRLNTNHIVTNNAFMLFYERID
ncbi:hypothetical protein ENUP19_0171G0019 [Entamoeba nuttalli]|uniref:Ubiquitin carboxyl-terminal hydrolase n=2 Tax=Entamoeba nuttalli TaxID=412467 RepID=K2HTG3_ENTNP|nr:ubiquitin carboxyl-terminal hydrolase domain containing protein [Entamoeba nuttalli P19]EKE39435.1 ubiquitin carboxyl-terminal hydrolase domain containing protein [Entamoeba nuttalli P19]|eukprot:XP_008858233.1 ubiquitin carboxyl-terminal hydrolase domain containing protein [Entamoeba nuttalli P19]